MLTCASNLRSHANDAYPARECRPFEIMSPEEKLCRCIRLAAEYRAIVALQEVTDAQRDDSTNGVNWHALFSERWPQAFTGKLKRLGVLLIGVPLGLLYVSVLMPMERLGRKRKAAKVALLQSAPELDDHAIRRRAASSVHNRLYPLWQEFGLHSSQHVPFDRRIECLERWIDILYGSSIASALDTKNRILSARDEQNRSRRGYANIGATVTFTDPIDVVAARISEELEPIAPSGDDA